MVVVSQATAAPDYARIKGLTFATTSAEEKSETRDSWGWGEVAASVLVLAAIIASYLYFRG
jgi:SSS family solute:Na+ symporter